MTWRNENLHSDGCTIFLKFLKEHRVNSSIVSHILQQCNLRHCDNIVMLCSSALMLLKDILHLEYCVKIYRCLHKPHCCLASMLALICGCCFLSAFRAITNADLNLDEWAPQFFKWPICVCVIRVLLEEFWELLEFWEKSSARWKCSCFCSL